MCIDLGLNKLASTELRLLILLLLIVFLRWWSGFFSRGHYRCADFVVVSGKQK